MGNDPALAHARTYFQNTTSKQGSKTQAREQRTKQRNTCNKKECEEALPSVPKASNTWKKTTMRRRQSAPRRKVLYREHCFFVLNFGKHTTVPKPHPTAPARQTKEQREPSCEHNQIKPIRKDMCRAACRIRNARKNKRKTKELSADKLPQPSAEDPSGRTLAIPIFVHTLEPGVAPPSVSHE